jgi:hypothetical protein
MKHNTLIFAGFMSVIIGNAYATGENIITSKSYVDAMDAKKQDTITAGTKGSVVTYDGEDENGHAQFSERGIYDGSSTYTNNDADELITAGTVHNFAAAVESITIPDNKLTCANSPTCTLWSITSDTANLTAQGTFAPLTAASCRAYGESVSSASQCCSGYLQRETSVCGCGDDSDCQANKCDSNTHICQAGKI